jgi:16S rRNA (guanine527-N7)-methyltransferase
MHPDRIAELLAPFLRSVPTSNSCHSEPATAGEAGPEPAEGESAVLSTSQLERISTYIDILLRWNARINLTAIRDPEQIVTRHFGESLFAARHLFARNADVGTAAQACPEPSRRGCPAERASAVADLGSGAGFPGIPLKLWAPHIALTLIEPNHKKAVFLREVVRALTLMDINILSARAEALGEDLRHSFDVVTLRAVERFATILPATASLVAPGGRLALLIGSSQQDLASTALPAFTWSPPIPIPLSTSRVLLIGRLIPL